MTADPITERMPVLVLGGGPAGLALALEVSLHEVAVTVIEPRRTVDHARPRAKTTSARTMELFRRWGVADAVRAAASLPAAWSDRVTFCSTVTGPEITAFTGVFGLDLIGSPLVAEHGQQVTQPVIEEVLRRAVEAAPTANLVLGQHGVDIDLRGDVVAVIVEDECGKRRRIEADFIVGADGPRSLVRRSIGARYEGSETGRPNVNITFRSRRLAALIPHPPSLHYWVLNPQAPGVVGPLDLDGTWWAISTGTASIADDAEAAAIVHRLLGRDDVDVDIVATDPWQARSLLTDRYRSGRAFLIGDAAHQNPPWGGHGFNTGVGDAANLGWKLAAVVNGWAPEALLDSYETERRPVAQATINVAAANTASLSLDFADPDLMADGPAFDAARQRAAAAVQRTKDAEFHSLGLVLGIRYGAEAAQAAPALGTYEPRIDAGGRLPHRVLPDGGSLYDLLGAGLAVVAQLSHASALIVAAERRGIPLTVLDPAAQGLNEPLGAEVLLVRPDQMVAWVGSAPSDAEAEAVLTDAVQGFDTPDTRANALSVQEQR